MSNLDTFNKWAKDIERDDIPIGFKYINIGMRTDIEGILEITEGNAHASFVGIMEAKELKLFPNPVNGLEGKSQIYKQFFSITGSGREILFEVIKASTLIQSTVRGEWFLKEIGELKAFDLKVSVPPDVSEVYNSWVKLRNFSKLPNKFRYVNIDGEIEDNATINVQEGNESSFFVAVKIDESIVLVMPNPVKDINDLIISYPKSFSMTGSTISKPAKVVMPLKIIRKGNTNKSIVDLLGIIS